jgi:acetyltransferase
LLPDSAVALPPLNRPLARRLLRRTRLGTALLGQPAWRERAAELEGLLVQVARLAVEQPALAGLSLDPVHLGQDRVLVLDASATLHAGDRPLSRLPGPAIRPYPITWETTLDLGAESVVVRPITPEDEPLVLAFHHQLGEATVADRFDGPMSLTQRINRDRLLRQCQVDYDREVAVVALQLDARGDPTAIAAIARLSRDRLERTSAELRLVVADRWQRKGIGGRLVAHLMKLAEAEGLQRITTTIPAGRPYFGALCQRLGFTFEAGVDNAGSRAVWQRR